MTGATKELRATVQVVGEMLEKGESITATSLSARLGVNRGTASRRVNAAINRDWIVNRETKKGQPWDSNSGNLCRRLKASRSRKAKGLLWCCTCNRGRNGECNTSICRNH